jgi:butyrate kinase
MNKACCLHNRLWVVAHLGESLSVVAQASGKLLQCYDTAGFGAMTPFLQVADHLFLGRRGTLPYRDQILTQGVGSVQLMTGLKDQAQF